MPAIKYVPGDDRLTTFPITEHRRPLWKQYKEALRCIWVPEDIRMNNDREHFERLLNRNERHFVEYILAFFSSFDGIVNINLAERFREEVKILEARYFYDLQIMMENVHAETYAQMLNVIIVDEDRKQQLLNAVYTMPIITKMAAWARKWIDGDSSETSFATRLVAMSAVEGVLFTGAFCAIYWLANKGGLMPGFSQANEYIARDERCHTVFATVLYDFIEPSERLSHDRIRELFTEAVDLSIEFIQEALPVDLLEMNHRLMSEYIKHMADNILGYYGVGPMYRTRNPFPFMAQINLPNKTDFFVRPVTEYSTSAAVSTAYEVVDDF